MRTNRPSAAARLFGVAIVMCCFLGSALAQTALSVGDIAFTGYNSDNPDDFSFVLLKNVQAGTTITFTDRGWQAAGGFRSGESTITITFAASRVAGEQFRVPATTGIFLDFWGMSAGTGAGPNLNLTASGDQLFAYQGAEPLDNSPAEQAKFIAALQMNGDWDADAVSDNTSARPPGLTNGVNALAIIPKVDNARYDCSATGPDVDALRAAIHDQANWLGDNNVRFALPPPCDLTCGLGTDNRPPLVFCPFEIEVFLDAACDYTIEDFRSQVYATDNCDPNFTLTQSPAPGDVVSDNTLITMTATDMFNNSATCSFQLFVTDDIEPQILSCPGDQTAVAGQGCLYTLPDYTGMLSAFDNCDPNPEVLQNPAPGTQISQSTMVELTVIDASGNSNTCAFMVILEDRAPPVVFCSVDRFATAGANCSFTLPDYRSQLFVMDECDPNPLVAQSPAPGTTVFDDTWISFKITDASGNEESCGFSLYLQDFTPPTVQCPTQQLNVSFTANCEAEMPDYRSLVTLSDNCDPNPTLTQLPAPGQALTGNTFALFLATDASNNFNFCFVPVFVRDDTPPTLVCRAPTLALGSSGTYALQAADVIESMSDDCGPVTVLSIEPAILGCEHAGLTVPITVTVRDAAGNTASCTTSATVSDVVNVSSPWVSTGIGNNGGSAVFRNCDDSFLLFSAGFNLGAADAIQFVHRTLCGNGEIIARIASVGPPGAAAGVMMRETLQPGSKKAALKTNHNSVVLRDVRFSTNLQTTFQQYPNPGFHKWLRVVRQGNSFLGYSSANGVNWEPRFVANILMGQCIEVGLFVESINQVTLANAVIDNVTFTGSATPLWGGPELQAMAQNETENLKVYPNPASDMTQVHWDGELPEQGLQLTLMNNLGRVVWTRAWAAGDGYTFQAPLNGLPPGVYLLQAADAAGARRTARIVVDR